MPLTQPDLHRMAEELATAESSRTPIDPLSSRHPELSTAQAYEIQLINAGKAVRENRRVVGFKIGLTSRDAQRHFDVHEPDFGHLFDDMAVLEDSEVDLSKLIQPKIEGEIAFVLGSDLKGPGVTIVDVLRAVDFATTAMEIIDSRIKDWKIRAADTIADNGSSARYVLSGHKTKIDGLDLVHAGMALWKNSEVSLTASGAAVMGNPLSAVAFLANELGIHNRSLLAGEVVLSGSLGGMLSVGDNDSYRCAIRSLGEVSVRFKRRS